jgi:hypothetical protein
MEKKFAVIIRDRDGREDFRLFRRRRDALLHAHPAALAATSRRCVDNGRRRFFEIVRVCLYEVTCDDEDSARRKIDEGTARVLLDSADTMTGADLVIDHIFEMLH